MSSPPTRRAAGSPPRNAPVWVALLAQLGRGALHGGRAAGGESAEDGGRGLRKRRRRKGRRPLTRRPADRCDYL